MDKFLTATKRFMSNEEGAQIIEYALIIAVVSIVLIVALRDLDGDDFNNFIDRVGVCLTDGANCA